MSVHAEVSTAFEAGDHKTVLRLTDAILDEHPGDDAAHAMRARSLLALDRAAEAEQHAAAAVRLDPEEVGYRELLAAVLSREGAHREAAAEYARLARNDPAQAGWNVAESAERVDAAQAGAGVEAARRAVKLEPANADAQLALSTALARVGDARGAYQAAVRAVELAPGSVAAREALADAHWLADEDAAAFTEFRSLVDELDPAGARRVASKARSLYRQHAGWLGRGIAAIPPLFDIAFRRGWLQVGS